MDNLHALAARLVAMPGLGQSVSVKQGRDLLRVLGEYLRGLPEVDRHRVIKEILRGNRGGFSYAGHIGPKAT